MSAPEPSFRLGTLRPGEHNHQPQEVQSGLFSCRGKWGSSAPALSCCLPPSAGVGRTGVFITLSIVLERMRYEGVVDIFQTVKMLRTQRPAMVQTEVSGWPTAASQLSPSLFPPL